MVSKPLFSNDLRQLAWAGLLHAHARLVAKMDAELAAKKLLSMSWYDVLLTLKRAPEQKLRLSDLANRVLLSRSGLTRLTDRIEAAGYLCRETAAEDRRGAYAKLLPAGDAALARTWIEYEKLIIEHFGQHLSDEEAAMLNRILSRLINPQPVESQPVAITVKARHS